MKPGAERCNRPTTVGGRTNSGRPGRPRTTSVGKRDSYVIVARPSPQFTARLVDRWQELEARASAPAATVTSRGIAELTGKRCDNVMRVCHELKPAGVTPQIEECHVINDLSNGRIFLEYRLNERDSLVLVARLSPEFTGRIVDRWMELESASRYSGKLLAAPAIPGTYVAAVRGASFRQTSPYNHAWWQKT